MVGEPHSWCLLLKVLSHFCNLDRLRIFQILFNFWFFSASQTLLQFISLFSHFTLSSQELSFESLLTPHWYPLWKENQNSVGIAKSPLKWNEKSLRRWDLCTFPPEWNVNFWPHIVLIQASRTSAQWSRNLRYLSDPCPKSLMKACLLRKTISFFHQSQSYFLQDNINSLVAFAFISLLLFLFPRTLFWFCPNLCVPNCNS